MWSPVPSETWLLVDVVTREVRSRMMAGIQGKNTKPEKIVRSLLHRQGYRFRLHRRDLPGRPDIVLSKHRAAVFVHGCFWHGHENCPLYRPPLSNTEFWNGKIGQNKARDARDQMALRSLGWRVITVWECILKGRASLSLPEVGDLLSEAVLADDSEIELRGQTI